MVGTFNTSLSIEHLERDPSGSIAEANCAINLG